MPIVVVDEAEDTPEEKKLAFDFRQGIRVLPPLPKKCTVLERAVLRNAMPGTHSSADNELKEASRVRASLIRRARSEQELF